MKYIISGTDLKQVDKYTIDTIGIPSLVLMERAALTVAEEIITLAEKTDKIAAVCGTGNNGADGIAVARILCNRGYDTCVYIIGNQEKGTDEFKLQRDIYKKVGGDIVDYDVNSIDVGSSCENYILNADIIVDAIFGVGLSRNVEGVFKSGIDIINNSGAKVVSVDVPSGIQADSGKIMGSAVEAEFTVTFGMQKTGLVMYPGADCAGKVIVADIGFPNFVFEKHFRYKVLENEDLTLIPKRSNDSNKGSYGKILIIAGSESMSGAAYMCAKAALRMGAGMVKVFTVKTVAELLKSMIPEAMITTYTDDDYADKLISDLAWCDVVALGPGLGVGELQKSIVNIVLSEKLPTVVDADGINCISEYEELKSKLHNNVIITPHVGEMSRFTGVAISDIKDNVFSVAKDSANKYDITVVLKDARTVTSDGEDVYINVSGNNGMSTAGAGDVLTGITASLFAKGMTSVMAGSMAAFIHGLAGDMAAYRLSKTALIATDLIDEIVNITRLIEE